MQLVMLTEAFATTFLTYLAYVMRYSYRCREVTKEINTKPYKNSLMYALGSLLLFDIFEVGYDFGTGSYKYTLLPNGHCAFVIQTEYITLRIIDVYVHVNEVIKMLLIAAFLVYYYKLNKMLTLVRHMPNTDTQQNRLYLKIAIT